MRIYDPLFRLRKVITISPILLEVMEVHCGFTPRQLRNLFTSGSEMARIIEAIIAKELKLNWNEKRNAPFDIYGKKGQRIEVRFCHAHGSLSLTKSAHRGIGRKFVESEFKAHLDELDGGFLIADTEHFPNIAVYHITSARVRELFKSEAIVNGTLARSKFVALRQSIADDVSLQLAHAC